MYLILYVEELLIAGSNQGEEDDLRRSSKIKFEMKDMGVLKNILGITTKRDQTNGILKMNKNGFLPRFWKVFIRLTVRENQCL